jgi:hypothetical protein
LRSVLCSFSVKLALFLLGKGHIGVGIGLVVSAKSQGTTWRACSS